MKLKPIEKLARVEVLRAARVHIESRKTNRLCYAIAMTKNGFDMTFHQLRQANRVRELICFALGPHCTVDSWLYPRIRRGELTLDADTMREYRLRWIDHMIAEVEAMP